MWRRGGGANHSGFGGEGSRGDEPLRRGRAGCTTAGPREDGTAPLGTRGQRRSRSGRSRLLRGNRDGRGDRHPSAGVSKLCGRKAGRKGRRVARGCARGMLRRALSLGAGASWRSPVRPVRTRISANYFSQTAGFFPPSNYSRLGPTQMFPWRWVSART